MRHYQIIGWDEKEQKVTGRHAEEARTRGALGQLWRERYCYNPRTHGWDSIMEPVEDHATA
jgi:hypothetical protein